MCLETSLVKSFTEGPLKGCLGQELRIFSQSNSWGYQLTVGNFLPSQNLLYVALSNKPRLLRLSRILLLNYYFFLALLPDLFPGSLSFLADFLAPIVLLSLGDISKSESSCYHCNLSEMSEKKMSAISHSNIAQFLVYVQNVFLVSSNCLPWAKTK